MWTFRRAVRLNIVFFSLLCGIINRTLADTVDNISKQIEFMYPPENASHGNCVRGIWYSLRGGGRRGKGKERLPGQYVFFSSAPLLIQFDQPERGLQLPFPLPRPPSSSSLFRAFASTLDLILNEW